MNAEFIDVELTKLAPVAGQVLLLRCPPEATLDEILPVLRHVNQNAPDGVSVACIDSNFNLTICNVPEVMALLERPHHIAH